MRMFLSALLLSVSVVGVSAYTIGHENGAHVQESRLVETYNDGFLDGEGNR